MGKNSRRAAAFGALAAGFVACSGMVSGVAAADAELTPQQQVFVDYLRAHGELMDDQTARSNAIDLGMVNCNALQSGLTREQLTDQLTGGAAQREEAILFLDAATAPGSLCG